MDGFTRLQDRHLFPALHPEGVGYSLITAATCSGFRACADAVDAGADYVGVPGCVVKRELRLSAASDRPSL